MGVAADLIVRAFQWKGARVSLRDFNRDAAHQEIGMQAVEIVGDDVDGDFDGVANEFTVGDMTAMAVYLAAQPRPTSKLELASLAADRAAARGGDRGHQPWPAGLRGRRLRVVPHAEPADQQPGLQRAQPERRASATRRSPRDRTRWRGGWTRSSP